MKSFLFGLVAPLVLCGFVEIYLRVSDDGKLIYARKISATPAIWTKLLLQENTNVKLVPLSGISHTKTILCKEDSGWFVYESDKFGFPNSDRIWDESHVDIALVGDSYFQGACLPEQKRIATHLSREYKVINFSLFDHGPLAQLGMVIEYLPALKPKRVILSYIPNDLFLDLSLEGNSKTLLNYLQGEKQNLIGRQGEVDMLWKELASHWKNRSPVGEVLYLKKFFFQQYLKYFRKAPQTAGYDPDYEVQDIEIYLSRYRQILGKVTEVVGAWGGEVFVVFIPDAYFFADRNHEQKSRYVHLFEQSVSVSGAKFINLEKMFSVDENPYDFYSTPSNYYGHFNEKGAARASEYLLAILKDNEKKAESH